MRKNIFIQVIWLICAVVFVTSCSKRVNFDDINDIKNSIKTSRDEFRKMITLNGPKYDNGDLAQEVIGEPGDGIFLRAWRQDGISKFSYQLYIIDSYYVHGNRAQYWIAYNDCWDEHGNNLDTTKISQDDLGCKVWRIGGSDELICTHKEHIGVNITEEYLKSHKNTGIKIKLTGKNADAIIHLPAKYISAFLYVTQQM